MEARLKEEVMNFEQEYGCMPKKSSTDTMVDLRMLLENYREFQKGLHCVYIDLELSYDRVLREVMWFCMRESGLAGM